MTILRETLGRDEILLELPLRVTSITDREHSTTLPAALREGHMKRIGTLLVALLACFTAKNKGSAP